MKSQVFKKLNDLHTSRQTIVECEFINQPVDDGWGQAWIFLGNCFTMLTGFIKQSIFPHYATNTEQLMMI